MQVVKEIFKAKNCIWVILFISSLQSTNDFNHVYSPYNTSSGKKKSKNIQTIVVTKNTPDFFSDIDFYSLYIQSQKKT